MSAKAFPQLSQSKEDELKESLLQWSLANGLVMYPPDFKPFSVSNAPITLFPTPFPKYAFEKARAIQETYNLLYANVVAKDKAWLLEVIEELSSYDKEFTQMLYHTYQKVVDENGGKIPQPITVGLFRSDYMLNKTEDEFDIKQIEFNTVSVSFGGLSTKVSELHNYLNKSGAYDNDYSNPYYDDDELPVSPSATKLAEGLKAANYRYNQQTDSTKTVVLFIVQNGERNSFDQRHIEYNLLTSYGIKSYRLSLEQVQTHTTINDGKLYIKSTMDEVSVVYYRSGYAPTDYESDKTLTWNGRYILEKSKAIKCPSLLTQLSGAKKIQQVLTAKEKVVSLLPDLDESEVTKIISTFVDIYPLDDSEQGKKAIEQAFKEPHRFVLKPQREGGGNNVYKENIPEFLNSLEKSEWGAYILMELIHPPTHKNKIIRYDEIYNEDIISELGVFGTIVFNEDSGEVFENKEAGWLLRSKFSSSNEGGVAAGFGCVDNIYLY